MLVLIALACSLAQTGVQLWSVRHREKLCSSSLLEMENGRELSTFLLLKQKQRHAYFTSPPAEAYTTQNKSELSNHHNITGNVYLSSSHYLGAAGLQHQVIQLDKAQNAEGWKSYKIILENWKASKQAIKHYPCF